jgi:membrane-associated phospholipid phosphatase
VSGKRVARRLAHGEHRAEKAAARLSLSRTVRRIGAVTEVADQPPLIAVSAATIVAGALLRRPALLRTGSRMLASHLVATAIKGVLKAEIDRSRPRRALQDGRHTVGSGRGDADPAFNSFPSGHTAGAVAVAEAVAGERPQAAGAARLAAGLVGAAQLPRGKHYLSDVAAGWIIGWASERIAAAAIGRIERWAAARRSPTPEEEAAAHPS